MSQGLGLLQALGLKGVGRLSGKMPDGQAKSEERSRTEMSFAEVLGTIGVRHAASRVLS